MRHRGIIMEKTIMWSKIQEMRFQGMSKSKIARELGIICEKTMYKFVKSVREQEKLPIEKSCRLSV